MRIFIAFLLAATFAGSAVARPNVYQMTCAQAVSVVTSNGAIVMNTGPYTYKRFVAHAGYCVLGEQAWRTWEATADTPQCRVGYECRPKWPKIKFDRH
jgi:hypothetical protein